MAGETDLDLMLRTLTVSVRPESFTVVTLDAPIPLDESVFAVLRETEGVTAVVTVDHAEREGWPVEFVAAWLTLEVHSSLEAVGLTAAVAGALADEGIPANVLAAYHHDHLLVPADRAADAVTRLERLRSS